MWLRFIQTVARRPALGALALFLGMSGSDPSDAPAQNLAMVSGGPRFFYASSKTARPVEVDVSRTTVLRRRVSLNLERPTMATLLAAIARQTGLEFLYSRESVPVNRIIGLRADSITVAAALTEILVDTGLDVLLSPGRQVVLLERRTLGPELQTGALVGRVVDTAGRPLANADVSLEGTRWSTSTDTAGRYRLAGVPAGRYTLAVRRIGYARHTQSVTVGEGEDTVDVVLAPQVLHLDELVSTATGQRRRREVPNDITVLNADSLMRTQPVHSVTDMLEGRVPGLTVQHTSGAPGDPSRLRLRGASSPMLNNDPIVVVDGIRVYAEQSAARSANLAGGGDYAAPSPLDYIDPNSIETIEVVKGPSAATLYGPDAANGVIVITTKKGKAGPTRWTASIEHGMSDMVKSYPERTLRWGHSLYAPTVLVTCPLSGFYSANAPCVPDSLVHFQLLNEPDLTPIGTGHNTAASLGVSGGVGALTYNVTGSYSSQRGLLQLPDVEIDRYTARLGQAPPDWMRRPQQFTQWGIASTLGAQLGPKADLSFQVRLSQNDQARSNLENQLGYFDAMYFDRASDTYHLFDQVDQVAAGIRNKYSTKVTAAATALTTGVTLNWRPRSWLATTALAGIDVTQRADELFLPRNASPGEIDSTGILADGQGRTLKQTLDLRATATRPVPGGFTLRFSAGANYISTTVRDVSVKTTNLPAGQETPGLNLTPPVRNASDQAVFGWYVEPTLDHGTFSLISGLRFDGGSSYGGRLTLPTFPKLGGSWLISDEPFFPFKSFFSAFRLRASYGRASRQPGPADKLRLYGPTSIVPVDGQEVPVVALTTLGNTQLRPERTGEFEGGFEADFLGSRIALDVAGSRKTTDDALLSTPLPPSISGGDNNLGLVRNIGVTRNTSLEITLGAQLVRSGPVTWAANLSVTHRRDEVVKLAPGVEPFSIGTGTRTGSYGDVQRVAPGYPLFGYWTKPVQGYADLNGNGLIEPGEVVLGDTLVYRGSPLPDYTAALSSSLALWHGAVRLTADLLYDKGMTQHLTDNLLAEQVGLSAGRNDPASSPAEQALVASTLAGTPYYWYQQVSTTRLNAVSVSYVAPTTLARRFGAQQLMLSLQGSNLGLWSSYRGIDPNVNNISTGNLMADGGQLPQPRIWQVRVNATY